MYIQAWIRIVPRSSKEAGRWANHSTIMVNTCNRISVLVFNRTTSMPKYVLHYDKDKNLTSIWYSVFAKSCFPNEIQLYLILFDVGNIS